MYIVLPSGGIDLSELRSDGLPRIGRSRGPRPGLSFDQAWTTLSFRQPIETTATRQRRLSRQIHDHTSDSHQQEEDAHPIFPRERDRILSAKMTHKHGRAFPCLPKRHRHEHEPRQKRMPFRLLFPPTQVDKDPKPNKAKHEIAQALRWYSEQRHPGSRLVRHLPITSIHRSRDCPKRQEWNTACAMTVCFQVRSNGSGWNRLCGEHKPMGRPHGSAEKAGGLCPAVTR